MLIFLTLCPLGICYFWMLLGRAWRLKQSFIGAIIGLSLSIGFVIYAFSIRNVSKDYNYFITSQEYSIFRLSFIFGIVQFLGLFITVNPPFFNSKIVIWVWIGSIVLVNVFAIIYNAIVKSVWHWQLGIIAFTLYSCCILIMIMF